MKGALFALTAAAVFGAPASTNSIGSPNAQKARSQTGAQVVQAICLPIAAKPSDVVAGKQVRDSYRLPLGSVELVGPDSAMVRGKDGSLRVPIQAFGLYCDGSLVLEISPHRFKRLAAEHSK